MTERLRAALRSTREEGRIAFAPYVTAGYPERDDCVPVLLALEAGGADIIEMGVPFSDPLADGATVEYANHVAVEAGIGFEDCLGFVREARAKGLRIPVAFMGYYNPLLAYGIERAVAGAIEAGADGFIVVDLPPEEAGEFVAQCRRHDAAFVPLVAPTSSDERIAAACEVASGFVYCVSVTGTTGQRETMPPELGAFVARVRARTELPLAVGFGISRREHVEEVGRIADAAAVGSAIITTLDAAPRTERAARVQAYVAEMTGRARSRA